MGILFLQVLPLNVDVSDLFTLTFKEEKSNQIDFVTMFALEIEALLLEIGLGYFRPPYLLLSRT